jgi:hypothetical protein
MPYSPTPESSTAIRLEMGYLLDYFRTSPEQCAVWKRSDRKTRRKLFAPVKIRTARDDRDGETTKRRQTQYDQIFRTGLSRDVSWISVHTREPVGELGPFIEKINLMAWLEEMVLRLGPSAVMYAQQFPHADQKLTRFLLEFGADLIEAYKKAS